LRSGSATTSNNNSNTSPLTKSARCGERRRNSR
jgi:hypothetical protein